jgi:hypothetical protein
VKPALFEVALLACVLFVVSTFCADSIAHKLLFPLQVSCFPAICGVTKNPRHFGFPLSFLKSENTKWCGVEAAEEDKAHWAICLDRQRLLSQSL